MRSHKYKAKRTEIDGIQFDSRAEAKYYQELKILKRAGIVKDIQLQPKYPLLETFRKDGKVYRGVNYIADFLVSYADGHEEIVDVKGAITQVYAIKRKWFESKYPDKTIKEVKV